jgi:hypothetical protein
MGTTMLTLNFGKLLFKGESSSRRETYVMGMTCATMATNRN